LSRSFHSHPVARYHTNRVLQVLAEAKEHGPAGVETRLLHEAVGLRTDNGNLRQGRQIQRDRRFYESKILTAVEQHPRCHLYIYIYV